MFSIIEKNITSLWGRIKQQFSWMIICAILEVLELTGKCVCNGGGSEPTGKLGVKFSEWTGKYGWQVYKSGECGSGHVLKMPTKKGKLWFHSMSLFYWTICLCFHDITSAFSNYFSKKILFLPPLCFVFF